MEETLADLEAEARQFWRSQGVIPIEEIRVSLEYILTREQKQRLKEVRTELQPLIDTLNELPLVQRLHRLPQLGGKVHPLTRRKLPNEAQTQHPFLHTRYIHSELLAEQAVFLGVKLGLPLEDLAYSYTAGLVHDVGHSAFSHQGDDVLQEFGYPNHEIRGMNYLSAQDVRGKLEAHGINIPKLFSILQEQGPLGSVEKVLDTLSYLVLDTAAVQISAYRDFGASFLANVVDIDDGIKVKDVGLVQEILEIRARLFQECYCHPDSRLIDAARKQLLRVALRKGCLQPEDIIHGEDAQLHLALQSMVQYDHKGRTALLGGRREASTPLAAYADLFHLTMGFGVERWDRFTYERPGELYQCLYQHRNNLLLLDQTIIIFPDDYTKKRLEVKSKDGKEHTLQAKLPLPEEAKLYHLYLPRRIF